METEEEDQLHETKSMDVEQPLTGAEQGSQPQPIDLLHVLPNSRPPHYLSLTKDQVLLWVLDLEDLRDRRQLSISRSQSLDAWQLGLDPFRTSLSPVPFK